MDRSEVAEVATPEPGESSVHSIIKAIKVLEMLSSQREGASLAQVSESTSLSKSTVHRILTILEGLDYVVQLQKNGQYRIGSQVIALGQRSLHLFDDIIQIAAPFLEELKEEFGATINMGRIESNVGIYIHKIDPPLGMMRTNVYIGMPFQLYCSALGKCMLSEFTPDELEGYWNSVEASLIKHTDNTIDNHQRLIDEVASVRQKGFALDVEEREIGVSCVAAPIRDFHGRIVNAISVATNTIKLKSLGVEAVALRVMEQANRISAGIGFRSTNSVQQESSK